MSISKERKDEIRKEWDKEWPFLECDTEEETAKVTAEVWLDILDRELEAQRERIVGEIWTVKTEAMMLDMSGPYVADLILNLPSLTRDGGEAEGKGV